MRMLPYVKECQKFQNDTIIRLEIAAIKLH